jgi:hypothetical protein
MCSTFGKADCIKVAGPISREKSRSFHFSRDNEKYIPPQAIVLQYYLRICPMEQYRDLEFK